MDVQAELGEPSHPLRNVPVAEIDGLEMPFELMPPSVASVVRSHLSEGLSTERPETWARVEASDDGQNGGELGRRAPTSFAVALLLYSNSSSRSTDHCPPLPLQSACAGAPGVRFRLRSRPLERQMGEEKASHVTRLPFVALLAASTEGLCDELTFVLINSASTLQGTNRYPSSRVRRGR